MSDDHFTQTEEVAKTNYFKKLAAPLAVAGVCGAAALLFANGKTETPATTELLGTPTELQGVSVPETCQSSFDRIFRDNNHKDFMTSDSFYDNLVDGKYEDPSFPANSSSLYWDIQNVSHWGDQIKVYKGYEKSPGIIWKRPSEIVNKNPGVNKPSLWGSEGVSVKTSHQGNLGDCWFLATATALAENPDRITQIFAQDEYTESGAFQMYFYVRGERVTVNIDDRIPLIYYGPKYLQQYEYPNNAPSPNGAWWLVLLEKAIAKLYVNYTNLDLGDPGLAMRALTNNPTSKHLSNAMTNDELWDIVFSAAANNFPMVAWSGPHPANTVAEGHAETVLGVQELKNPDGSIHAKLIVMRNPWGKYAYTGPWSDKSDLWTPEFKKQARYGDATDGIFFTPMEDWRKEYVALAINHIRDWKVSTIQGKQSVYLGDTETAEWLDFHNPVEQDVSIECDQYANRLFPQTTTCEVFEQYPQSYYVYLWDGASENPHHYRTKLDFANCDGESITVKNLAPGDYYLAIWNFSGSDKGRATWQIRTFAEKQEAPVQYRDAPATWTN